MESERKNLLKKFTRDTNLKFNNIGLLNRAFTHKSYANEKGKTIRNNERLEFLGDSVLGLIIANYLFKTYSDLPEGELARIKSFIVSEDILSKLAVDLNLSFYILLGKGEDQTGGRNKKAILADTFEALLGAIYIDLGLRAVTKFILPRFESEIDLVVSNKMGREYKTLLQEYIQKKYKECPMYEVVDEIGPEHEKIFVVKVRHKETVIGKGEGKSKKEAEKHAAEDAYQKLGIDEE